MEKRVRRRAQTAGPNPGRGATKKGKISRTLFSINLHFLFHTFSGQRGRGSKSQTHLWTSYMEASLRPTSLSAGQVDIETLSAAWPNKKFTSAL